jgi:CubicO group peptidase (beta-lactamase class C family)
MRFRLSLLAAALVALAFAPSAGAADASLAEVLQPFVEKNQLAGAVVLVADRDKILDVEAGGVAAREAKTPMKTDDLFWIASMTKPMTAAAVMMLVDEKKVALDDPIEKYLPEFKTAMVIAEQDKDHVLLKKPTRPPTLRDCLRHTSGMPFRSALEEPTLDRFQLRDAVRSYAMTPLQYEPGTKHVYSNAGINTAGRIVEVVSGMSYEDFMAKRLFAPLGMTDTTWRPTADQMKRLAKSYKPTKDGKNLEVITVTQLAQPLTDPARQPVPAGGLFSTAKDTAAFGQMILRGGTYGNTRILSEASVREMTGTQTGDILNKGRGENGYGLGLSTSRMAKADGPAVCGGCGHGGAYATNLAINPDKKLVLVYMVQHAGFPGDGGKAHGVFEQAAVKMYGK